MQSKLQAFATKVRMWNKENFGNIKQRKKRTLARLQGIQRDRCKGPVVTEDLEEAEQVDGDATMDDQFVEDTLILDDESDKTIEEGVSNAGPVEDGLVNLGEGEQPIDSRLPKPSASVTLVKPKEGVGKSQGLHPRKTSAFKSGGPKIKDVAISKVTSASAKKGVGGVGINTAMSYGPMIGKQSAWNLTNLTSR
ncbi:hypothetical protein CCACVL1_21701 [Corchorus capsularis]|uniref:Uncharacterized protein n=1 Tax=Corchorus capsularis TaxID=210143 RepID=A0A1R3H2G8_COCAP|nr:hypothetical protein CCACVL1_21701 [Corchorus capsularis]